MSAVSWFITLMGIGVGCAACSPDDGVSFTNGCTGDAASTTGCGSPQAGAGGLAGTGGAGGATGGTIGAGGTAAAGGMSAGGLVATGGVAGAGGGLGGAGPGPDASLAKCPVSGGGVSLTPPGWCTVLAYCGVTEFRLVCQNGAPTCACKTKGVVQKTIPNDPSFCVKFGDGGTRPNLDMANTACGWDLDTSTFNR